MNWSLTAEQNGNYLTFLQRQYFASIIMGNMIIMAIQYITAGCKKLE